eukprot:gnl/TRDRNA2_/TRDRNA2_41652_c0_seq1.p1 gnl/TRDRNA2_/TRDRNA2_41652_c0~~gnl/TRDRNA2_/TRDRNA2_41652_c0_seq1.p1  ORF type:complete len:252 (+),score=35.06 gnl/TRDRNA2_/TRDRNA2_41652_c0_seq1:191-946(+)
MPMVDAMLRFPGRDVKDEIFLDLNPNTFATLLDVARGRGSSLLRFLGQAELEAVRCDADFLQMDIFHRNPTFTFFIAQSNPYAKITNGGTVYTMGVVGRENTVLGDTPLPPRGRHYWEVQVMERPESDLGSLRVGIVEEGADLMKPVGEDAYGWAWLARNNESYVTHGDRTAHKDVFPKATGRGQVIGIDIDMDQGTFHLWENGHFVGLCFSNLRNKRLFPAFSIYSTTVIKLVSGLSPPDVVTEAASAWP